MSVYEMAENYYASGLWSAGRIMALVAAGKLTQTQADEIMGKEV